MSRVLATREDSRLLAVITAVAVIATLYFAHAVLVPLALSLLLSLVLTPPVSALEKVKLPRILAIFLVVVILVGLVGLIGWKTSEQFIDLSSMLPTYKATLQEKIHFFNGSRTQSLNKATDTVKELQKEIGADSADPATGTEKKPAAPGTTAARPLNVEVVPRTNLMESFQNVLGPLTLAGVIIVFTVFILAGREDLRNRFIRLAGGGRLSSMTQALDEASQRIKRYLFLQLLVNCGYGLVIFTALHFIGIPNAALWGVAAAILRFMPYVGPPAAALMPVALSLAVFPGWGHAIATAGLFLVVEILVANFVEPLLYGAHLGLAPLAILIAAIFWTLIWGLAGLVLSTPITVCLVVMGRYVPSLGFLNVILGDEPVLEPHAQYYQRLLATDVTEARQVLDEFLREKPFDELCSTIVIPALILAEKDRHRNELDDETQNFIYQTTREIIEELAELSAETQNGETKEKPSEQLREGFEGRNQLEVLCIPARDDADHVVALMVARLLERQGHTALSIPISTTADMLSQAMELKPLVVCISALPPFVVGHARALYTKLKAQSPDVHVVICLWHFEGDPLKAANRFNLDRNDGFFTTLPQVLQYIAAWTEKITHGEADSQPRV